MGFLSFWKKAASNATLEELEANTDLDKWSDTIEASEVKIDDEFASVNGTRFSIGDITDISINKDADTENDISGSMIIRRRYLDKSSHLHFEQLYLTFDNDSKTLLDDFLNSATDINESIRTKSLEFYDFRFRDIYFPKENTNRYFIKNEPNDSHPLPL